MSFFNTPSSTGQSNNTPTSAAPASGGLFGSSTTPASSGSLFGGTQPTTAPMFSFSNAATGASSAATTPSGTAGGSMFGASSAKPGEQKSLFGASTSGTPSSTPTLGGGVAAGGSVFGGSSQTPSSSNMFGSKPAATSTTGPSLFGTTPNATPASTTPATTTPASNLFGQDKSAATTATSKPGGLFGTAGVSATPGSPSLFGNANSSTTPAAQATPAKPTLFQNSTTPAGAPSGGLNLFSKPGAQSSSSMFSPVQQGERKEIQPNTLLGNQASLQSKPVTGLPTAAAAGAPSMMPTSSLFSGTKPAESSSAFGVKPASTGAADGAGGSSLFGQQAPAKPAETATSIKPSMFATTSTTPSGSAPSLFKTPGAAQTPSAAAPAPTAMQPNSLFGNVNKPAAATTATEAPKPQASSMFSGFSKPAASSATTDAAKPASLFSTMSTSTAPAATAAAPSIGLPASGVSSSAPATSTTAAPASATAPSGSLFGAPKAATSTEPTAPKPATAQSANLGASTSGPTSAMARLKNKTMDEIMSRWATDLSKYQKEFKEQASQVAAWDRLLVENGEKIQKLYLNTFEAEKASREVERHLVTVESQQEELESWLDKYELEIDALFSKQLGQGEQLTGPDQERERTYKLAEKITERLDEMGRDLTKMIKEINEISGTVSKSSKPDDPLSQIVRVLNGHLTQLQWIDTNAAALQAKIAAAQKASSQIGSQYGVPEQDNADTFYRSYMGRK